MVARTIPVVEVFGPTLQGEGALAGKPTYFIRTGGCDYTCHWCDTDIAVLPEMVRLAPKIDQEALIEQLTDHIAESPGPDWVTISGGNPAMHELGEVVDFLDSQLMYTAVETQGSKWKDWLSRVDLLTVSPKGPSSGLTVRKSLENLSAFLSQWATSPERRDERDHRVVLKVVVFGEEDYEFAQEVHQTYTDFDFYLSVGTAMGGLRGDFVPPPLGLKTYDRFEQVRDDLATHGSEVVFGNDLSHEGSGWTVRAITDDTDSLLARWRWLADKVKADPIFADVALFPQTHALIWGIHTRGV